MNKAEIEAARAGIDLFFDLAMPHLVKLAAVVSGSEVTAVGEKFIARPAEPSYRKQLWVQAYMAAYSCGVTFAPSECASEADKAVQLFAARFPDE